jgi:hypothetical protein
LFFALVYLLLRHVVRLTAGSSNELLHTEVELMVLRHQLKVLKRRVSRPRLRRSDRLFMAAVSRALPRARWSSFVVSPQTLLRWHRELVRRKWIYKRSSVGGRPPISAEVRELILRIGREVGVHPDPGRARQAGNQGLGDEDPNAPAGERARPRSPAIGANVERIPQVPGSRDPGVRLLYCRDCLAAHAVCAICDRGRIAPSPHRGRNGQPRVGVGHPAGPQPGDGGAPSTNPVRDP